MIYGYARSAQGPVDTTFPEPVDKIFTDIGSGLHIGPQLRELIDTVRPGDTILTYSPNRLGRTMLLIHELLELIHSKGAIIHFTDGSKPSDELVRALNHMGEVIESQTKGLR